jgi:hypothetical protein
MLTDYSFTAKVYDSYDKWANNGEGGTLGYVAKKVWGGVVTAGAAVVETVGNIASAFMSAANLLGRLKG